MKISVIIPAYNSAETIGRCLEAVFKSDFKDFEVIVVDDASKDETCEIVKRFDCRLFSIKDNSGPAYAREIGRKNAHHETTVFVDSDIIINENTFGKLAQYMEDNPDADVVTGILSKAHPNSNFFSQYKNLYMNYIFSKCPAEIDFVYGAFYAVRKKNSGLYTVSTRTGEDSELGMMLNRMGYRIFLNKELEVTHLKAYSCLSFIKNDFRVPYNWVDIFIRMKGFKKILAQKRFSHARLPQILSIAASFAILINIFYGLPAVLICIFVFLVFNIEFFIFLQKEAGLLFAIKAAFITWFDMLIMGAGIITGFLLYPLKQKSAGSGFLSP